VSEAADAVLLNLFEILVVFFAVAVLGVGDGLSLISTTFF
jgi:hypothetical protein